MSITSDGLTYWTGSTIDPPGAVIPSGAPVQADAPASSPQAPAPGASPAPALTEADIAANISASIVQVITDQAEGSGVQIRDGILTNAHVVADGRQVELATSDRRRAPARVSSVKETRSW
jgi:S1-C subfamily serine protease